MILLAAGCVAVLIFSVRESYRNTTRDIDLTSENIRNLVLSYIDIYDRMYALVFFFGNSSSEDKAEFAIPENANMQELYDINSQIDFQISLLCEKASKSDSFMKERGTSVKKLYAEIEAHESNFFTSTALFNERVACAKHYSSFKLSKYVLKKLEPCIHKEIVFEK